MNNDREKIRSRIAATRLECMDFLFWIYFSIRYGSLHPTFVIIGAQKAGTTSLHRYLGQHPDIFMGQIKESNLFLDDSDEKGSYQALEPFLYGSSNREKRMHRTNRQILRRMFRGYQGEPVIGHAAPYYTCAPFTALEVPRRIHEMDPGMRIVYSLRNPMARMASSYAHDARLYQMAKQPFPDDFNTRIRSRPHYLEMSLYFKQLKRYLDYFPVEHIHVLLLEDLRDSPDSTLGALTRFLNVDDKFTFDVSIAHGKNPNRDTKEMPIFSEENYEILIDPIRRDISSMEAFLGRSLSCWDLSKTRWCHSQT